MNVKRIKMYLHRINAFDSYNRGASLFRTSNALCFIQDMYLRKKSHCQVEWNISRGIYTNSEFSSTSHCCLGYLRLHEEWGKAWRNCTPRKMTCCGSELGTRTGINILISLSSLCISRNNGCFMCVLQTLKYVRDYAIDFLFSSRKMRMISFVLHF